MDRLEALKIFGVDCDPIREHYSPSEIGPSIPPGPEIINKILVGMKIITDAYNNEQVEMDADPSEIWYGKFEESIKNMTKDKVILLAQSGWFIDEEGWWMHLV